MNDIRDKVMDCLGNLSDGDALIGRIQLPGQPFAGPIASLSGSLGSLI